MLRFATVHSRCSPGGATWCLATSRYAKSANPRCYTVAYEYQWNFRGTYDRYVICKVQNSSYIPRQKRAAIRVVKKISNGVINETLPSYTLLRRIKKLLRIIQITCIKNNKHGLNTVSVVESAHTGFYRIYTVTPPLLYRYSSDPPFDWQEWGLRWLSSVTHRGQAGSHCISTVDTAHAGLLRFRPVVLR